MFKIDLEKAYDHVEWEFVDYILFKFGFGGIWREWICECISTTSFSILVNGSPSKLFKVQEVFSRGIPYFLPIYNCGRSLELTFGESERRGADWRL